MNPPFWSSCSLTQCQRWMAKHFFFNQKSCTKEREFIKVQQILQIDVLSLITQQLSLHQTW